MSIMDAEDLLVERFGDKVSVKKAIQMLGPRKSITAQVSLAARLHHKWPMVCLRQLPVEQRSLAQANHQKTVIVRNRGCLGLQTPGAGDPEDHGNAAAAGEEGRHDASAARA